MVIRSNLALSPVLILCGVVRSALIIKIMTKKLTDLYVVAKDNDLLFNDCVYDFQTAESVCAIAQEQGYANAEVITLSFAMRGMYSF